MNDFNLFDVWREENEDERIYTWKRRNKTGEIQMGRLDFYLVSQSLVNYSCQEKYVQNIDQIILF